MKLTRRISALLCLLLAACLLLCACGAQESAPAPDPVIPEDDGLGGDASGGEQPDLAGYAGIYVCETDGDWTYLDIHDDGSWVLYGDDDSELTGWLQYEEEYGAIYAYNDTDSSGCRFEEAGPGRLYLSAYGYFNDGSDESGSDEDVIGDSGWYDFEDFPSNEDAGGYGEWVDAESDDSPSNEDAGGYGDGWTEDNIHTPVSELEGTWYFDGDLAADRFIVIDSDGDWSYYSRASGDAEAEELDCGSLTPVDGEMSTYYADSYWYDGVRYRVFEFDTGILTWGDEGSFECAY